MTAKRLFEMNVLLCSALLLAGCASVKMSSNPCEMAERPISLNVLVQNSMSGVYEACLSQTRLEASKALGS